MTKLDGKWGGGYNTIGLKVMPVLYIVATPIGNLEDISLRAIRVLGEVGLIAAEDTRRTKRLLNKYEIKKPLTSYHEHNKITKLDYLLDKLTEIDVALVSDAGMPGISDPGYELVSAAVAGGIKVVPIPGPSSLITALAVAALPADRFLYIGFLATKSGERKKQLETVAAEAGSILALETPHRLRAALADILTTLGDRRISVCRQLTKLHEEVFRGTVSAALEHFTSPRGEFVLVIDGAAEQKEKEITPQIINRLEELKKEGKKAREATAQLAQESGISRRLLYRVWLKLV
jgi:16S rRNA (cytidine1402-2'-O)-methyltransferase